MSAGGTTDVDEISSGAGTEPAGTRVRDGQARGPGRGHHGQHPQHRPRASPSSSSTRAPRSWSSGRSEEKGKEALAEMGAGDRAAFRPATRSKQDAGRGAGGLRLRRGTAASTSWSTTSAGPRAGRWSATCSDEAWQKALDWNLNSYFWGSRRALRYMTGTGWGRIINISSVEGKMANKAAVSHYITNKHAINGLTKAIAYEYATQGITCNAICPGAVETDLMKEVGPQAAAVAGLDVRGVPPGLRRRVDDQAAQHRGGGRCRRGLAGQRARRRGHRRAHQRRRRHLALVARPGPGAPRRPRPVRQAPAQKEDLWSVGSPTRSGGSASRTTRARTPGRCCPTRAARWAGRWSSSRACSRAGCAGSWSSGCTPTASCPTTRRRWPGCSAATST